MSDREKRCRYCWWYRGVLTGICVNPLIAQLEGQFGLGRWAGGSCTLWTPKHQHRDLTDNDLAEHDRQARRIREEKR